MDNNIKIIGLTGKARAGKDSVALILRDYIVKHSETSENFEDTYVIGIESFAAPIKSMVAMLLDFFGKGEIMNPATLQQYIDGEDKETVLEEIGASPRVMMQTLGTEWGRKIIKDDIWINCMLTRFKGYQPIMDMGYKGGFIVVTDVRFNNEAEAIVNAGGILAKVEREAAPDEVGDGGHESEAGVDDKYVSIVIENHGSWNELITEVVDKFRDTLPPMPEFNQTEGIDVDETSEHAAHS